MNTLHLFDAFGIELEYMLVDRETLDVRPVADQVLAALAGGTTTNDFEAGPMTWSNELALHVLELKTTDPAKRLRTLPSQLENAIRDIQPTLEQLHLRLLPTAMHPWMNPAVETQLWPHEYHEVYQAYDRVFGCRSHGWSNVQSVHLNLPFCGDEEFARLHAAARLVLPLLPALCASSPVVDGHYSGHLDTRMRFYADHCRVIPALTGPLIPEPIFDEATYRDQILRPIYAAIEPHDPTGAMRHEFLNARGAIARFDRGSIELRVMDVQEYPGADVAICAAVIAVIKSLVAETWLPLEQQQQVSSESLRSILENVSACGETAMIEDTAWLRHFGISAPRCRASEWWQRLLEQTRGENPALANLSAPLQIIAEQGTLATRIQTALGPTFSQDDLVNVYGQLADCLEQWQPFTP